MLNNASGCFTTNGDIIEDITPPPTGNTGSMKSGTYIDANHTGTSVKNPMAGHATGPDIHPYSMYLVPLITY